MMAAPAPLLDAAAAACGDAEEPATAVAPSQMQQSGGTLKQLCPADKQKVAQLIKQVVELGRENQALSAKAEATEGKLRQLQDVNRQAVKEHGSLKSKLGQAVTVLRMYHHKVQGLDAALRALQHTAPEAPAARPQAASEAAGPEDTAAAPEAGPQDTAAAAAAAAASEARREQQQGGQAEQGAAATANTAGQEAAAPIGQQHQQTGNVAAAADASAASNNAPPVMLELAAWHMLAGGCPEAASEQQAAGGQQRVLQFDASIGSHGAFVIQALPELPPCSMRDAPAAAGGGQLTQGGSPTSRQLQHLAQAFDSLALPAHQAGGGDALAAERSGGLAAGTHSGSAGGALGSRQPSSSSACSAAASVAAAAAAVGSAAALLARGPVAAPPQAAAPLPAAASSPPPTVPTVLPGGQQVEEVPALDLDVSQVHVLVQNEKSASSLPALSSGLRPADACVQPPGGVPSWQAHQQQQQHQAESVCSWLGSSDSRHAGQQHHQQQPQVWRSSAEAGVLQPHNGAVRPAGFTRHGLKHPVPPGAPAAAGQHELPPWAAGAAGAGLPPRPVFDTRRLLLRFDASLVDLLSEVERLEQQQQQLQGGSSTSGSGRVASGQQQQRRQRQHWPQQPPPQQQQQWGPANYSSGAWAGQPHTWQHAAEQENSLPAWQQQQHHVDSLDKRQQALQARVMRLQQHEAALQRGGSSAHVAAWLQQQQPSHGVGGGAAPGWLDDDDVSDILNQLD